MPIISVTGATVRMEAQRLIECGADAVLTKPLTRLAVEKAVRQFK